MHNPIDVIWLLICTCLVMLMQAGFCCLESGLVRTKNSINVAIKNLVDFSITALLYWAVGYGIMFGVSRSGLWGTTHFFYQPSGSSWQSVFFLYQTVFCGTAATIVAGAVAERMRLKGYLFICVAISVLIYPVYGHWVWAGVDTGSPTGWLAKIGFIDFAGASVVHSVGGWISLAGVLVIGPRIGRFNQEKTSVIPGHNIPLATLGTLLLWVGWLGFNGGAGLQFDDRVPVILINTLLSGAAGGLTAFGISLWYSGRSDVVSVMNGVLAGAVAITASCHMVSPVSSIVIGSIGAMIALASIRWLEAKQIDDAVGAMPVHAAAGVWGTLAVALFADPSQWSTGLTRWQQLGVQTIGVAACFIWTFGISYALIWLLHRQIGLRPSEEQERQGLNYAEHGATTAVLDLLQDMDQHRRSGEFSHQVTVEPHTEVGQIADQYNRVLHEVQSRTGQLIEARNHAVEAQHQLESTVQELRDFNRLAVGREHRMVELKEEINDLARQLGRPEPYDLGFVKSTVKPEEVES